MLLCSNSFANTRDGLRGWWGLDDTSASDSSWKGNSGSNTAITVVNNCPRGSCYSFDGTTSVVNISGFVLTNAFPITIAAWIYPTAVGNFPMIYQVNSAIQFYLFSSGQFLGAFVGGSDHSSSVLMPLNAWTHAAMTYDGTTIHWFVNGVDSANTADSSNPSVSSTASAIGGSQKWHGMIDDVRVYNRVLTAQEIKDLYNAGEIRNN